MLNIYKKNVKECVIDIIFNKKNWYIYFMHSLFEELEENCLRFFKFEFVFANNVALLIFLLKNHLNIVIIKLL